jgi:peptidoglycan/xylan/chitin deacetylase (PgdA/CDA1 family)
MRVVYEGPRHEDRVALTFDDGPSPHVTPGILDVLAHYGAHATFFVLGHRIEEAEDLLARMVAEGHEIGSHGYSHRSMRTLFKTQIVAELDDTARLVRDAVDLRPRLLRPPFGHYADSALPLFAAGGYDLVLWTVDSLDWEQDGPATVRTIVRHTRPGSIVLLHDTKLETLRALPQIIGSLHARGLELVTVSELTEVSPYR